MLGDDIARALPELQAMAEGNMRDACIITRKGTGEPQWNESTGQYDHPADTTIYEGRCRLQDNRAQIGSSGQSAGEVVLVTQDGELQLPMVGTDGIAIGDVAEFVSSVNDDSLVGRQFTIEALHHKSQATARRLRVKEGTGA